MNLPERPSAVVLDIEGTTTPITFVYDVLFPYAREHVASFLREHAQREDVQADLELLRTQARRDLETAEFADAPQIPSQGEDLIEAAVANVLWQMSRDRKTTGLKSLQGKIWRDGYHRGELLGEVYDDVPVALRSWQRDGVANYIYSSGSVEAQKLLFGHSTHGDLRPLLSGYFDTTTGPKKQASSYEAIAAAIGEEPSGLVFATDHIEEARAADQAGWGVVILCRPGNAVLPPEHGFATAKQLTDLPGGHRH